MRVDEGEAIELTPCDRQLLVLRFVRLVRSSARGRGCEDAKPAKHASRENLQSTTHRSLLKGLHLLGSAPCLQQPPTSHFSHTNALNKDGRQQQQRRPRAAGIRDVSHRPRLEFFGRTASCGGRGGFFFRRRRGSKCGSRRHSNADDYRGGNARRARGTNTASIAGPEAEGNLVRSTVYSGKVRVSR